MKYELRRMTSYDIFPICTIIKKVGVDEVKKIVSSPELQDMVKKKENADSIGLAFFLDIASLIIGNLPKCEAELYKFLASMTKASEKELKEISMSEFLELVIAVIKHEDFKDFFKVASQLLK